MNKQIKKYLIKKQIKGFKNSSGKNNYGKITVRHKGGGQKQRYREIDFNRKNFSIGIVIGIEYDPNRTAHIASVFEINKNNFIYILATKKLKVGDIVESGIFAGLKSGNSLPLFKIPIGTCIHNIPLGLLKPATLTRSAGTYSILKEKNEKNAKIQISSKKYKRIPTQCYVGIGIVSNELNFLKKLQKAGQSRWLNIRPTVRGVAMNPVDHPHGGGEGKTSGNNRTPWGKKKYNY